MSEQSSIKFLFTKEGRGILIGTIVLLVIVGTVGVITFNALFGSTDAEETERQRENAPPASETNVNAARGDIRADVTSQNMNDEARAILDDYNDQADEFGLMPVPTPNNVEMVEVDSEQSEEPEEPTGLAQNQTAQQAQRDRANNQRPMTKEQRKAIEDTREGRRDALLEYRNSRLDAAQELMTVYATPSTNASVSFNSGDAGSKEDTGTLPRVSRNSDGTASFQKGTDGPQQGGQCETPLVKGGEIRYAQTDIALNTDFRGPVRMTFLDGNIDGWIGMGTFELNEFGARMKLTINQLIDPDGQSYSANGYVLDPDTTLWAMASDVDRHIIYRYGGFGLGVILSAFGELADQREVQSETINANGASSTNYREPDGKQVTWRLLGEFSRLFEEAFANNLNRPITVTLDPNQEAGVLFEDTVCENDSDLTKARKEAEERAANGFSDPVKAEVPQY